MILTILKYICLCIFMLCLTPLASAQYIEEVRDSFDQTHQLMIISYNIKKFSFKKNVQVLPVVYLNNDSMDLLNSRHITGDYGWINYKRKNYSIRWNTFKDGIDDFSAVKIELKSNVEKAYILNKWSVAWHGSNSAPLGFKISQLGLIGWYTAFRVGNIAPPYKYTIQNSGKINEFNESGVYEIGSRSKLASFAFTLGPIAQLYHNLYAYAGLGYGKEQLFWEYKSYNLNKEFISNQWALNESINNKGLFFDLGLIFTKKRLSYDLGFSSNSLKSFQIIGGIGILFDKKQ